MTVINVTFYFFLSHTSKSCRGYCARTSWINSPSYLRSKPLEACTRIPLVSACIRQEAVEQYYNFSSTGYVTFFALTPQFSSVISKLLFPNRLCHGLPVVRLDLCAVRYRVHRLLHHFMGFLSIVSVRPRTKQAWRTPCTMSPHYFLAHTSENDGDMRQTLMSPDLISDELIRLVDTAMTPAIFVYARKQYEQQITCALI
jgi:hypothetical protein